MHIKRSVREFYDTFGWRKDANGFYGDTAAFEDNRPVLRDYWQQTHLRVKEFIRPHGRYYLDAGSGAISHPEYLAYSDGYERHVCADFSYQALVEARIKLAEQGWYVVADLTHLPFKSDTFDAAVSAHVIYHIPAEEQAAAIREIGRTVCPACNFLIVYMQVDRLRRLVKNMPVIRTLWTDVLKPLLRRGKQVTQTPPNESEPKPPHAAIYVHTHPLRWFRRTFGREWQVEMRSWRSVGAEFTRRFIPDGALGRQLLHLLYRLEGAFPHAMARLGRYQIIIFSKP
jgi:SAM-dependent methyltransferase